LKFASSVDRSRRRSSASRGSQASRSAGAKPRQDVRAP
jgi:hypothetical protein